jgi:hypothetical protein
LSAPIPTFIWTKAIEQTIVSRSIYQIHHLGFICLEADHSIFQKGEDTHLILVAVYINDMLIFTELIEPVTSFKRELANMSDLSEAR